MHEIVVYAEPLGRWLHLVGERTGRVLPAGSSEATPADFLRILDLVARGMPKDRAIERVIG